MNLDILFKNRDKDKKIELNKNYRSHPDVIDFYNRWMISTFEEKNAKGMEKNGADRKI